MRDYIKRIFKKKLMMHSKVLLHVEVAYFLGDGGEGGGREWSSKLGPIQLC